MSIKNKIKPDEYGKDAKKPLPVEKVKPQALSAVQNLSKKGMDLKTPFFLHTAYYEGGEPFLAVGESTGLEKKFKTEKNSDKVAYGNLYLQKEGPDEIVYFEYFPSQGKFKKNTEWEKLFKVFKKWLKRECKLIIAGEQEEVEGTDDTATTPQQEPKDAKTLAAQIKALGAAYKHITTEQHQPVEVKKMYKRLSNWLGHYEKLDKEEQTKLKAHLERVNQLLEGTKRQIKQDQILNRELDKVIKLANAYAESFSKETGEEITKLLQGINKLATALNDQEILEQTKELESLIGIALFEK